MNGGWLTGAPGSFGEIQVSLSEIKTKWETILSISPEAGEVEDFFMIQYRKRKNYTTEEAAELFDAAADVLETYGWVQHDLGDTESGFCMIGAFNHVLTTDQRFVNHMGLPGNVETLLQVQNVGIPTFNDEICLTKYAAIDRLRMTAKRLRNGEVILDDS